MASYGTNFRVINVIVLLKLFQKRWLLLIISTYILLLFSWKCWAFSWIVIISDLLTHLFDIVTDNKVKSPTYKRILTITLFVWLLLPTFTKSGLDEVTSDTIMSVGSRQKQSHLFILSISSINNTLICINLFDLFNSWYSSYSWLYVYLRWSH